MKVEIVKVTRKYNLGNYEMLDVGYEAALTDIEGSSSQEVLKVTQALEKLCDEYYTAGRWQKQETPKEEPKQNGDAIDLESLEWEDMPATAKGPWQKTQTKNTTYFAVKKAIEAKDGKAVFIDGYLIWMLSDEGLGRRKQ